MTHRNEPLKVHLAHQWWVSRRGGERLFEEIASLFPAAAISTLFLRRETLSPAMLGRDWSVSTLRHLGPRLIDHRKLLPLYPWAVRRFRVPEGTQLLLTSDAALIKGICKPDGCIHVCYCHSPPRYLWDMANQYAGDMGVVSRRLFQAMLPRLRAFDLAAAANVDYFIANSAFVAERIQRIYSRDSVIIHPAVDVSRFSSLPETNGYYLVVSELLGYKRVDLAVEACRLARRKLVVIGDGPEAKALKQLAAGGDVEFLGRASDAEVERHLARCRAFLHPQLEDFGIAAVEAQASGRPVIAFRGGGALETNRDGETGMFFDQQTPESLRDAITRFEAAAGSFSAERCRRNAMNFSSTCFRENMVKYLTSVMPEIMA